jgi:cation transport ATPase
MLELEETFIAEHAPAEFAETVEAIEDAREMERAREAERNSARQLKLMVDRERFKIEDKARREQARRLAEHEIRQERWAEMERETVARLERERAMREAFQAQLAEQNKREAKILAEERAEREAALARDAKRTARRNAIGAGVFTVPFAVLMGAGVAGALHDGAWGGAIMCLVFCVAAIYLFWKKHRAGFSSAPASAKPALTPLLVPKRAPSIGTAPLIDPVHLERRNEAQTALQQLGYGVHEAAIAIAHVAERSGQRRKWPPWCAPA